ncbi:TfoX/Sxy family protein [Stappia sp. BW2]|uniref:TfoX/Sxy family protein n=1 Tax=Stappia sp. BW2 TaxID=2592622 RepID=UPI0011DECDC6|nr:TfoX/Sxy family protein [Stappia sp. BW2]TYC64887.1 TfoX/Sxy family protein [Stappia sp. BW2]
MSDLMETVLIERTRALIPDDKVEQKRMFGSTCFMINGNMTVCVSRRGLMARVGTGQQADALAKPFASVCQIGDRLMPGFIRVAAEGIENDDDLKSWIDMARSYAASLPPKAAKPKKPNPGKAAT